MEVHRKEFQVLHESLEFSQQQVVTFAAENQVVRELVKSLTEEKIQLSKKNKNMKETILDL